MWFVVPYVAGKAHQNLNLCGVLSLCCLEGTHFTFQTFFLSQKFLPTLVSDSLFKNKPVWHNLRECVSSSFPVRAPVCAQYINKYKQLSESRFNTGSGFGPEFLMALITNIKTGNEEEKNWRALRAPPLSRWKTQVLGFTFHMFSSVYLQRSLWKINSEELRVWLQSFAKRQSKQSRRFTPNKDTAAAFWPQLIILKRVNTHVDSLWNV